MAFTFSRRVLARFAFIIGLLLMVSGSVFLLGSLAGTSKFSVILAFVFVIAGITSAMIAIRLNKRPVYLFFASFFLMSGFFLFFSALGIIPHDVFYKAWPLISVFSGLALLPAGLRRYGRWHARFIVPSTVFLLLGCFLMIFSFDIVDFSFRQFILNWWPLLLCLAGVLLVIISLGTKNGSGDSGH